MTRGLRAWAGVMAVCSLATLSGCTTMTGKTAGQNVDDAKTTTEVKAKLTAEKLHNLTWVGVDTNKGVVYLTGNAPSAAERARAVQIARGVRGVTRVVDDIQIPSRAATIAQERATSRPSASPASRGMVTGEVTSVDTQSGKLAVKTSEGTMDLQMPPSAVQGLKVGDRVEIAVRPVR